jgi:hypothetical protein
MGCGGFESDDDGVVSGRGSVCGKLSNVSWEKLGYEVRRGRKTHQSQQAARRCGVGFALRKPQVHSVRV